MCLWVFGRCWKSALSSRVLTTAALKLQVLALRERLRCARSITQAANFSVVFTWAEAAFREA